MKKCNIDDFPARLVVTIIFVVIAAVSFLTAIFSNDFDVVSTNLLYFMLSVIGSLIILDVFNITYQETPSEEDAKTDE